ncbi:MAG: hypothetical protein ACYCPT_09970 [Acidimicrobiales bacterium]
MVLVDDDNTLTRTADTQRADTAASNSPLLPWSRGPLSCAVLSALQREPSTLGATPPVSGVDALSDDDFSLALYLCYEVHYRGVGGKNWEWDVDLLTFRTELEQAFERRLRDEIAPTKSPSLRDNFGAR